MQHWNESETKIVSVTKFIIRVGKVNCTRSCAQGAAMNVNQICISIVCDCLLQAEVQQVYSDGSLSLHTRSLKYGKVISIKLVNKMCMVVCDKPGTKR